MTRPAITVDSADAALAHRVVLSADELRELTGKQRADSQARELDHLGITYRRRRDGSVVVLRADLDRATISGPTEPQLHL